jgi:phosphoribosylformylglycinamidine cyclo-ligase
MLARVTETKLTYKDAGVNIAAQDEALARAKQAIRATFTPGVMADVGLFGGLFDPSRVGLGDHILVASADGVGTKLEVAARAKRYDTVGRDLVNHCVNDILVQGARPMFFLDYVGTGLLEPGVVSALITSCAEGCRENGMALLGGETAEMPGLYRPGDFDLVGFVVGAVRRDRVLDGKRVRPGQVLLGLRSSGLHTNGYSLARKVVFERLGLALDDRPLELGGASVADALLAIHRSYLNVLWPLLEQDGIEALAHITGGGLVDNVPRVLGGCDAIIDRKAWVRPGLFSLLVDRGGVDPENCWQAFNMGIGMVLFLEPERADAARAHLRAVGEDFVELGATRAAASGKGRVVWA